MIPVRISLCGFMSYRELQEFDFEEDGIFVLEGQNGVGKSTLFDAITFVLFGQHRIGKQNSTELINHDSDRLEVTLVLRLEEGRFRLYRSVPRKGRPTWQISLVGDDGSLQHVPGTEQKKGFDDWIVRHLPLDYEGFTTSVLLLQGKSEKLIDKEPKDRREVLAQLLDLSRYENLHERAKRRQERFSQQADRIQDELRALPEVRSELIAEADLELASIQRAHDSIDREIETLITLLPQAQRYEDLMAFSQELERSAAAQEAILQEADAIRKASDTDRELRQLRGPLEQALDVINNVERLEKTLSQWTDGEQGFIQEQTNLTRRLQDQKKQEEEKRGELEEITHQEDMLRVQEPELSARADLARRLSELERKILERGKLILELPTEDDEVTCKQQRDAARERWSQSQKLESKVENDEDRTKTRLADFCNLLATFSEPARTCRLCGQNVSEAHARSEQEHLEEKLKELSLRRIEKQKESELAGAVYNQASQRCDEILSAASRRKELAGLQDKEEQQRTELLKGQDPAVLADAINQHRKLKESLGLLKTKRDTCGKDYRTITEFLRQTDAAYMELIQKRERLQETQKQSRETLQHANGQLLILQSRLPGWLWPPGQEGLVELERRLTSVAPLAGMIAKLVEAEKHPAAKKRAEVLAELDRVPESARRKKQVLEEELRGKKQDRKGLQDKRDEVTQKVKELRQALQKREILARDLELASHEEHLYAKLVTILGPEGLLRWLLEDAEEEVVRLANRELSGLSGGHIKLSLRRVLGKDDEGEDTKNASNKALDLLVHNQETSNEPTALALASGSQKFRIAISLALAIGRYLARETQRIDSVIIDEGFGCLDRSNRDDAVRVLRDLGSHLQRVILVSHQEEFSHRFAGGYHIELRDRTSVPTRVRR